MFKNRHIVLLLMAIVSTNLLSAICFAESDNIQIPEKVMLLDAPPQGYDIVTASIQLSEDLKHVTYVAYSDSNKKFVHHNNLSSAGYYAIKPGTPFFSPKNNHHVYIAYGAKNRTAFVVVDRKPGPTFDNVDNFKFSPDETKYAYRAIKNDRQCMVVDGKPGIWYTGIPVKNNMLFSPDSKHFAYVALKNDKCVLVLDGKEQKHTFQFIDDVHFSYNSKRVFYKGRLDKTRTTEKWCAVIDGQKGKEYEKIFDMVVSLDSKKIAYAAFIGNKMTLVVDGIEKEYHDRYGLPVFSPDSQHLAYSYFKKNNAYLIIDGEKIGKYKSVYSFFFSPDSSRFGFIVQDGNEWYCIVDEEESDSYLSIGGFKFSPDSSRYAFGAIGEDNNGYVIIDGKSSKGHMGVGEPYFSPDSKHTVYRSRRADDGKWITMLDGKMYGNYYNAISKYSFSKDSKHLAFKGLVELGKKSVMVLDGKEQCADHNFKIIGSIFFSPDNNHIAYHVRAGKNQWKLVVDGHILNETYGGFFKDSPIIFDAPNKFHTLALKEPGPEFLSIEVDIPQHVKIQTEMLQQ